MALHAMARPRSGLSPRRAENGIGGHGRVHEPQGGEVPVFRRYSMDELKKATQNFSPKHIVSSAAEGHPDKAPNVVYRGRLASGRWVAVKRFQKPAWSDSKRFAAEAAKIGSVRHEGIVPMIGFCCQLEERLLVADLMPSQTLAQHLFHWEKEPMPWLARMELALKLARALEYLNSGAGLPVYHDLNSYRILFDNVGISVLALGDLKSWIPRLALLGQGAQSGGNLTGFLPRDAGRVTAESVVYSYGTILLDLVSGKRIPPRHALDLIKGKSVLSLVDSHVDEKYHNSAEVVVRLAASCLQLEPRARPSLPAIVAALYESQQLTVEAKENADAEAHPREEAIPASARTSPPETDEEAGTSGALPPLGKAAQDGNLARMQELMLRAGYKEDDGAQNELSFMVWTQVMQDQLDARKAGDRAFREQRWKDAIKAYEMWSRLGSAPSAAAPSATMTARVALAELMLGNWNEGLRQALQAQYANPNWPTPFFLQAAALAQLGMPDDAHDMLREGQRLHARRPPSSSSAPPRAPSPPLPPAYDTSFAFS
eukprot:SM000018S03743  [mRNA]  locus=s18:1128770:1131524:- [translate_table: standard]